MDANPLHLLLGADAARPALLLPDGSERTYGWLERTSARLAGALVEAGVRTGDRVVVQVEKSVEQVTLYLACLRLGAVFVPLNAAYTETEVTGFVADAEPALVVLAPDVAPPDGRRHVTLGAGGTGSLLALAATATPHEAIVARAEDDWAAMLYTSGTTGRSKGAMLSCRNLTANARALVDAWRFEPDDVLVHVLPTFHVHGLFVALHCALAVGAAIRFHHRFDPAATIEDLRRSTVLMGVPTHYHRLLAEPDLDRATCEDMRLFTSGSAPLSAPTHDAFTERTGHRIVERYGMTETMILTSNPYDGDRRAGTVGFALAGTEVRVHASDRAAEPGETGAVEVRGPGVFLGYWGLPERTAEATTPDGWFRTGDLGHLDERGRLTLVGRSGDTIISGGLNVYPADVEAVLEVLPGVAECAVVGLPDPDLGEVVAVAVVVEPGAQADEAVLVAACAPLARFKHPRRVAFVDALPRNAMGKVDRVALRAAFDA